MVRVRVVIKAIIFDYGGVLMRTENPAGRREWETRLTLIEGTLDQVVHGSAIWIQAQRGELSHEDYWRGIAQNLNIDVADIPSLRYDYFRGDQLDSDMVAMIRELRGRGLNLGLLSNDTTPLEDKLRDELRIHDAFDVVVISAKIGVMKPDAGAYQHILDLLNVQPHETIFIDDNLANIDGAARLGIRAIHYRAGMELRAAIEAVIKETA